MCAIRYFCAACKRRAPTIPSHVASAAGSALFQITGDAKVYRNFIGLMLAFKLRTTSNAILELDLRSAWVDYLAIQGSGSFSLNLIQGHKSFESEFFHCSEMKPVEGTAIRGSRMTMLPQRCGEYRGWQITEMKRIEITQSSQSARVL